ncbi:hypothetical protein JDM601_1965 [Mycolicibacter sinensis]|uniref:Uncharacterized protein n=1 Tax=Mycolicibacter sinensis (strain JDM601) TaxID=875328 RepID=F5Z3R5_MYCSD|nr:hypothetical protein JDM601_1965 [Mycolicibacter sinensis]
MAGTLGVAANVASMMPRTVHRHLPQSPPAPHIAATSFDVDAPAATASLTI